MNRHVRGIALTVTMGVEVDTAEAHFLHSHYYYYCETVLNNNIVIAVQRYFLTELPQRKARVAPKESWSVANKLYKNISFTGYSIFSAQPMAMFQLYPLN